MTLRLAVARPYLTYVDNRMVASKGPTSCVRASHAAGVPISFISNCLDTLIGAGLGCGSLITLGLHPKTFDKTFQFLRSAKMMIADPFVHILLMINPEAHVNFQERCDNYQGGKRRITFVKNMSKIFEKILSKDAALPVIPAEGEGFLSNYVISTLISKGREFRISDHIFHRHVSSRLTYLALLIGCIVARTVDGIISIPVALAAICRGGKNEALNNLAFRTLQAPGIVFDLFYFAVKVINPWAKADPS
jgi:hypothetical protein